MATPLITKSAHVTRRDIHGCLVHCNDELPKNEQSLTGLPGYEHISLSARSSSDVMDKSHRCLMSRHVVA